MKKSVILTIAVIYIFAIVIVGFIGIRQGAYNENVYVDDIVIISDNYKKYDATTDVGKQKIEEGYEGYIQTNFKEGLKIEIKCQVKPDNATLKKLQYSVDDPNNQNYKLVENSDGTATIEFYGGAVIRLVIKSTDTKGVIKQIEIKVFDFGDI
jgi:hypothetical protein